MLPAWYQYSAAPAAPGVGPEWREYRGRFPPEPPVQYPPAQYSYLHGPIILYSDRVDLAPMWPGGYAPPRESARIQAVDRPMGIHPSLGFLRNPVQTGIHVTIDMSRPSLAGPIPAVEYRGIGGAGAAAAELPQVCHGQPVTPNQAHSCKEMERMPAFDQGTRKVHVLVQFETGAGLGSLWRAFRRRSSAYRRSHRHAGKFTWAATIETDRTMTVRSFVEALHRKLYEPVGEEELAFAARKDAWTREKSRRLTAHTVPEGPMRKVCRVDMLGSQHVFRGLYRDPGFEDIIAAKYGRDSDDAAIAWVAEFRAS